jgi:uncharacterized protein YhhL (DUF1145 family)
MNDEIYKEPKTKQKELRDSYRTILVIAGVLIIVRLIENSGSRWLFGVSIVWGVIVLLHALKVFIFKEKVIGKESEGEEKVMENESKSK